MTRVQPAFLAISAMIRRASSPSLAKWTCPPFLLDRSLKLLEIIIEIVERVLLDVAGEGPQGVGVGQFEHALLPALVLPHGCWR